MLTAYRRVHTTYGPRLQLPIKRHSDYRYGWTVYGSNPGRGNKYFSSPQRPHQLRSPPNPLFNGNRGYFSGANRRERKVNHSSPSSAEVKNEWRYTSTPPYASMELDRENFTYCGMYKLPKTNLPFHSKTLIQNHHKQTKNYNSVPPLIS